MLRTHTLTRSSPSCCALTLRLVAALKAGPITRVCHVCGRQYGLSSFGIHLKQCKKLWITQVCMWAALLALLCVCIAQVEHHSRYALC